MSCENCQSFENCDIVDSCSCEVVHNGETPSVQLDDQVKVLEREKANLSQSLSRLQEEKREIHELQVQLDAAQEALFVHQQKTTDHIEAMEEILLASDKKCILTEEREREALDRIKSLEKALEEIQIHKNILQKQHSDSLEEICKMDQEKTEHVEQTRREMQRSLEQLAHDLELKEEDNIRLRMTLLKVQNDLSRDNRRKDDVIEERDLRIQQLETALSELRLQSEQRDMEVTAQKEELRAKTLVREDTQQETETRLTTLREKMDRQEAELSRLRRENEQLKSTLAKLELQRSKVNGLVTIRGSKEDSESSQGLLHQETLCEEEERLSCDMERRLAQAEEKSKSAQERADHMTLLLNQKLIELNKLQLTLSNQTKDMIQLEKAYFQLRCHLGKSYRSPASSSSRSSRVDLVSS